MRSVTGPRRCTAVWGLADLRGRRSDEEPGMTMRMLTTRTQSRLGTRAEAQTLGSCAWRSDVVGRRPGHPRGSTGPSRAPLLFHVVVQGSIWQHPVPTADNPKKIEPSMFDRQISRDLPCSRWWRWLAIGCHAIQLAMRNRADPNTSGCQTSHRSSSWIREPAPARMVIMLKKSVPKNCTAAWPCSRGRAAAPGIDGSSRSAIAPRSDGETRVSAPARRRHR